MVKGKQFVSASANLMAEWDWEKNQELDPHNVAWKSDKKAWWLILLYSMVTAIMMN